VKRLMLIGAVLAMLAGLVFASPAIAGSANAAPAHRTNFLPSHIHAASPGTAVTAGSQWTFYNVEFGVRNYCQVISFGSGKIFSDDLGGAGKWSGSTKSTKFAWTVGGSAGYSVKDSWMRNGYWMGPYTFSGDTFGPTLLVQGVDPLGWTGC